jgi:hypothetical protein
MDFKFNVLLLLVTIFYIGKFIKKEGSKLFFYEF